MKDLKIIHKIKDLTSLIKNKKNIGLVPTMGALHNGHKSLIERAAKENEFVVVSVFVNPSQFAPNEDYDKYPRTLESDAALCKQAGADVVFAPAADEMYTKIYFEEKETTLVCPPYKYVDRLCGKSRPGHFDGVCTIVAKLFNIVKPNKAYFGKKDAQQLFIVKKMVEELNFDVKIIECPIVRENDGLAISSRNSYLDDSERALAVNISKALFKAKELKENGVKDSSVLIDTALSYLKKLDAEYVEIVSQEDFCPVKEAANNALMLIAAKTPINHVRLIDNTEL